VEIQVVNEFPVYRDDDDYDYDDGDYDNLMMMTDNDEVIMITMVNNA